MSKKLGRLLWFFLSFIVKKVLSTLLRSFARRCPKSSVSKEVNVVCRLLRVVGVAGLCLSKFEVLLQFSLTFPREEAKRLSSLVLSVAVRGLVVVVVDVVVAVTGESVRQVLTLAGWLVVRWCSRGRMCIAAVGGTRRRRRDRSTDPSRDHDQGSIMHCCSFSWLGIGNGARE